MTQCSCIECTNEATHTWSGRPTCDECASPNRKEKQHNSEVKPKLDWEWVEKILNPDEALKDVGSNPDYLMMHDYRRLYECLMDAKNEINDLKEDMQKISKLGAYISDLSVAISIANKHVKWK